MLVERNPNGSISVSAEFSDHLKTVTYYFCSEYEAVETFLIEEAVVDSDVSADCMAWLEANEDCMAWLEETEESE